MTALDDPRCEHPGCDAISSVAWEFTVQTSGGLAGGARVQCASGHWYSRFGPDVVDPFLDEPENAEEPGA